MQTSKYGIAALKKSEGCELSAYQDIVGVWTIGVGHTAAAGTPFPVKGMTIASAEADELLSHDLRGLEVDISSCVTVKLEQYQFDALVSFVFNLGIGNFKKSTLLKKINAGKFEACPAEFLKWGNAGGKPCAALLHRRHAEAALFSGIGVVQSDPKDARRAPDQPVASKHITMSKEGNAAVLTGATSAVAALSTISEQAQQASDAVETITKLLHNPVFALLVVGAIAAAAIWYWRNRRLNEEAN